MCKNVDLLGKHVGIVLVFVFSARYQSHWKLLANIINMKCFLILVSVLVLQRPLELVEISCMRSAAIRVSLLIAQPLVLYGHKHVLQVIKNSGTGALRWTGVGRTFVLLLFSFHLFFQLSLQQVCINHVLRKDCPTFSLFLSKFKFGVVNLAAQCLERNLHLSTMKEQACPSLASSLLLPCVLFHTWPWPPSHAPIMRCQMFYSDIIYNSAS